MPWSDDDDELATFPLCNMTESYNFLIIELYDVLVKSNSDIVNITGCLPNCVYYKYEMAKIKTMGARVGSGQPGCTTC